jgi:hypothetical protein
LNVLYLRWTPTFLRTAATKQGMSSRIAETIRTLDQLDEVSLRRCGLDGEDTAALADALKVNTSVKSIYLESNQIGDAGVTALAEALKVNSSVTLINLDGNQISKKGATALADALQVNTSLLDVSLFANVAIDASILATIRESTDRNKRLQHLFLYDARRMLLSLMCADECGVVWPYFLESGNIMDGIVVPANIDVLRATLASIVVARQLHQ